MKPTPRILVSRCSAAMRRLLNEDEAAQAMARFGFSTVHLEELNFEQQVRLFHDAEFIAGAHGAGFANLLFASRAKVLELFANDRFRPLYFFWLIHWGLIMNFCRAARRTASRTSASRLLTWKKPLNECYCATERRMEQTRVMPKLK